MWAHRLVLSSLAAACLVSLTACNLNQLVESLWESDLRSSSNTEVALTPDDEDNYEAPQAIFSPPLELPDRPDDSESDYMSDEYRDGPGGHPEGENSLRYGGGYEGQEGYFESDEAEYMSGRYRDGIDSSPGDGEMERDGAEYGDEEDRDEDEEEYMSSRYRGGPGSTGNDEDHPGGSYNGSSYDEEDREEERRAAEYMSSSSRDGPRNSDEGQGNFAGSGARRPPNPTNNQSGGKNATVRLQRGVALAQTTTEGTLMSFNIEYEASGIRQDANTRYLLLIKPPRGQAQTMVVKLKAEGFLYAVKREWKDLRGQFQAQVLEERRGQGVRAVSRVLKITTG